MSRVLGFLLAGLFSLVSCRESVESGQPSGFESTSVLQLHPSLMAEGKVDWSREADLLQSGELFEGLAAQVDLPVQRVREAVRFELDVLEEKVRIIARDEQAELAQIICEGFAERYLEMRKAAEIKFAREALTRINEDLISEEAKVKQHRAELEKLVKDYGIPVIEGGDSPLESDRVTYQKALEALKEAEEVKIPEDGVLYQKEE